MSSDHDWDRPAPGGLHLVQQLVNSADLEEGTDELSDPEALGAWLGEPDLAAAGERFDAAGLERVIAFREAVRRLLLAHNGGPLDREAEGTLDALAGGGGGRRWTRWRPARACTSSSARRARRHSCRAQGASTGRWDACSPPSRARR